MEFSIKDFFSNLVTFTEEILNGKLPFLSFMTMQWNAERDEILLILILLNGGYKCLFCYLFCIKCL